jgi:hypothetical protein
MQSGNSIISGKFYFVAQVILEELATCSSAISNGQLRIVANRIHHSMGDLGNRSLRDIQAFWGDRRLRNRYHRSTCWSDHLLCNGSAASRHNRIPARPCRMVACIEVLLPRWLDKISANGDCDMDSCYNRRLAASNATWPILATGR